MNLNAIKRNAWSREWESIDSRYVFVKGGRSSGKTTEVAITLVQLALRSSESYIILCCREVQKSLTDSTYETLKKSIKMLGAEKHFKFLLNKIVCRFNNVRFVFYGLHKNPESVMSMEDIRYCWVEQAEKISEHSLQILLPSVDRSLEGRGRIFFTWNPFYEDDPIELYAKRYKEYSVRVQATYKDNCFFPDGMNIERKICKSEMSEIYAHVWLGAYKKQSDRFFVLPHNELMQVIDLHKKFNYSPENFRTSSTGLDMSDEGVDYPALALRKGSCLTYAQELKKGNAAQVCEQIAPLFSENCVAECFYDAGGPGAALKSEFYNLKKNNKLYFTPKPVFFGEAVRGGKNPYMTSGTHITTNQQYFFRLNSQMYWNLRLRLKNSLKAIQGLQVNGNRCLFLTKNIGKKAIHQLSQITYEVDRDRMIKVDKKGGSSKSPDIADAVALSFCGDCEFGLKH